MIATTFLYKFKEKAPKFENQTKKTSPKNIDAGACGRYIPQIVGGLAKRAWRSA